MKKKSLPRKKVYRTNRDTISLNCDEFCPGWLRSQQEPSFELLRIFGPVPLLSHLPAAFIALKKSGFNTETARSAGRKVRRTRIGKLCR